MTPINPQPNIPKITGGFETSYFKEEKNLPPGFYKSLIFNLCEIISAFFLGWFSYRYLNNLAGFWHIFLFLFLFLIFAVLNSLLNKNWKSRVFVIFLETIAFFVYFYNKFNLNIILILFFAFFLFRILGEIITYREFQNSIKISFLRFTRYVFSNSITAFLLVFIGFYILKLDSPQKFLSLDYFNFLWDQFSTIYEKIYPEIKINNSFFEFTRSMILYQLQNQKDFNLLMPDEKEKLINESTLQLNEKISKILNEEKIDANEKFSAIIYKFLTKKINEFYNNFGIYFVVLWGIILFLIFKFIASILRVVFNIVFFIIFNFLITLDIIKITGEPKVKEIISF
jgi:hypothetical protein